MGGRGGSSGMMPGGSDKNFTEFRDRPSYSHEYAGTGQRQIDFFNQYSNYNDLINKMTVTEQDHFYDWSQGEFMDGQQYRGFSNMSKENQRQTRTYDKYLDQSVLDRGVVVARLASSRLITPNNRNASLDDLNAAKGTLIPVSANMSFGAARQGLTIGDSSKRYEYKLHIPGGTRGAGMWIGDNRINGWGALQREFMTNRDIVIEVGDSHYDSSRGIYVVNLHYVGRMKHKYK